MSARSRNIHAVGGRLCYGVTDISTGTFPYDGVELGLVSECFLYPPAGVYYLPIEEDGSTAKAVYTGGDAVVSLRMLNYHADTMGAVFPGKSTGAAGGAIVTFPSKVGQSATALSNLYFEAEDPEHISWFIPSAIPELEAQERLWFSQYRWLQFPVIFRSKADDAGRALVVGLKGDLTAL